LIVVDASAVLELLLRTDKSDGVAAIALEPNQQLHAPELVDIEVAQTLRRLVIHKELGNERAVEVLTDYKDLNIQRHAHGPLLDRIWELRDAVSAYDGAYIALAEALDAPVVTCDGKLARSNGHSAAFVLI
jgi:predicted nucleic acid-binding protein